MRRAAFAVLLLSPAFAGAETPEELRAKIAVYEARVAANPGFDWAAHNELRHLYLGIDDLRSLHHSDVILKHSVMDDYILRIRSGWQLDKDPALALATLKVTAESKDDRFKFISAACRIKAGDLAAGLGDVFDARLLYNMVAVSPDPDMAAYRSLANVRLRQLKLPWRHAIPLAVAYWGLAAGPAVAWLFLYWSCLRRRRARERLAQGARALGARRSYEVCYRAERSETGFRLCPWDGVGLLLVHRGQPVLLSERGEDWLGEGCVAVWKGRRAGAPWLALEGRGSKHYFTAEPGVWPFGSERATRGLLAKLEEDLAPKDSPGPAGPGASPGKVRGSAL